MIVLETKRLLLRHFEDADLYPLYEIFSDAETMRHYPAPFTLKKTGDWIKRNQQRYAAEGCGLLAVVLKENGRVVGDCGLVNQTVEGRKEVEIGYHIHKDYWGRGYATEAAAACKNYGFHSKGLQKVISIISPDNKASITVAKKIGLSLEKESFIFGKMHHIYAHSIKKENDTWSKAADHH